MLPIEAVSGDLSLLPWGEAKASASSATDSETLKHASGSLAMTLLSDQGAPPMLPLDGTLAETRSHLFSASAVLRSLLRVVVGAM
jgi:hypothetical protein